MCYRYIEVAVQPIHYEWVDSDYVLSLMGQIGKIQNLHV